MTKQALTTFILAGLAEHGPTFGIRLLMQFLLGAALAGREINDPEIVRLAEAAGVGLEAVARLTAEMEDKLP